MPSTVEIVYGSKKNPMFFMLLMFLCGFSLFRYYLTLKRGTSLEKKIIVLFPTKDAVICATFKFSPFRFYFPLENGVVLCLNSSSENI